MIVGDWGKKWTWKRRRKSLILIIKEGPKVGRMKIIVIKSLSPPSSPIPDSFFE